MGSQTAAAGDERGLIPCGCQQIGREDIAAVTDVLTSQFLTPGPVGPVGPAFEATFAAWHQVAHAVATSDATAAKLEGAYRYDALLARAPLALPARSGSMRTTGEKIRSFAGRPIFTCSVKVPRASVPFDEVLISTNIEEGGRRAESKFARQRYLAAAS
ncbi:MAG: DegT/DnrJ/EryC1/StrS family aminotransferase [Erythrobacter sp.]